MGDEMVTIRKAGYLKLQQKLEIEQTENARLRAVLVNMEMGYDGREHRIVRALALVTSLEAPCTAPLLELLWTIKSVDLPPKRFVELDEYLMVQRRSRRRRQAAPSSEQTA